MFSRDELTTCPTCGGPVGIAGDEEEGTHYMVPALTGAQVDAAYRMVAAVKTWRGRMSPAGVTLHADQSDLLLAARDFELIERGRTALADADRRNGHG